MPDRKVLWFDLSADPSGELTDKAGHLDYPVLVCRVPDLDKPALASLPKKTRLALVVDTQAQADAAAQHTLSAKIEHYLSPDPDVALALQKTSGKDCGWVSQVNDAAALAATVERAGTFPLLVVRFKDPTNIPLELVLATSQRHATRVFKQVERAQDGTVSLQTMEQGCHGIILRTGQLSELVDLAEAFAQSGDAHLELKPAEVVGISHAGMGDRVCIDTTSILGEDEGMLLGSTSAGGIMTCSETHYLPYMNLRPFRVNAGSVHLYVWGPQGKALYLSDLRAGDQVWAVNSGGRARIVTVGRVKIERRPLLLVEARIGETTVNSFIQDDWHVRLFGSQGEIRPSSEIAVGDKLLGFTDKPGRHVGISINESIREQ